jgi:hypothetical protein
MNTNKDLENVLDDFINPDEENFNKKIKEQKKVILDNRQGLIERVDKVFVTDDGRQLLREVY